MAALPFQLKAGVEAKSIEWHLQCGEGRPSSGCERENNSEDGSNSAFYCSGWSLSGPLGRSVGRQRQGSVGDPGAVLRWAHHVAAPPRSPLPEIDKKQAV